MLVNGENYLLRTILDRLSMFLDNYKNLECSFAFKLIFESKYINFLMKYNQGEHLHLQMTRQHKCLNC